MKSNKSLGTLWEYQFFTKALDLGLGLYIPAGDNLPVDCVLSSNGNLKRVQIKGTTKNHEDGQGFGRYKIIAGTGQSSKKPLDCREVDILAVYLKAADTWYIVPCNALDGKVSLWFYPDNPDSKAKYEKYKEAWDLI
jgi:hypothetical protein